MTFLIASVSFTVIFLLAQCLLNFTDFYKDEARTVPRLRPMSKRYDVCTTFDFDPVNWKFYWKIDTPTRTPIRMNYSLNETEHCLNLYRKIFEEKAVKWMFFKNGTKLNLGCKKNTQMCEEKPHW